MSTLVLMKAFERAPARYDLGMRLITFGEIGELRRSIAAAIPTNANVLDIGCGTGELLPLLTQRGARVTAIDKAPEMVELARANVSADGNQASVAVNRNTAMEIDRLFKDGEFDAIVLSLVMSELTNDERAWVLNQCARVLKPKGLLMIADEFRPESLLKRFAFSLVRFPLHLVTYLYAHIKGLVTPNIWWKIYYVVVELPLMLLSFFVSEPLTQPLKASELALPNNVKIVKTSALWGGAIRLLTIQKEDPV